MCFLVYFDIFRRKTLFIYLRRRRYPRSWLSHSGVGQISIFDMQSVTPEEGTLNNYAKETRSRGNKNIMLNSAEHEL